MGFDRRTAALIVAAVVLLIVLTVYVLYGFIMEQRGAYAPGA